MSNGMKEIDGLMTYIGKLKQDNFVKDTDGHFKRIQVINFNIIHNQAKGEKIESDLVKGYESIDNSWLKYYPEKEKSTKHYCLLLGLQGKMFFSKKK